MLKYFSAVQMFVFLTMISRMAYLSESFQTRVVPYKEQAFVQVYPFLFTSFAIIALIKYKTHILYIIREEQATPFVKLGFVGL